MDHPTNLMMIVGLITLDAPITLQQLRDTLAKRLLPFRRFRQRIVESALGLGRPTWEDDPTFNLDSHLHHIALPSPGSRTQLLDLISDLSSTPLDFSKPLWHMHLVDNYGEGCACILRVHHCIGDGTALVAVIMRLMDMENNNEREVASTVRRQMRRGLMSSIAGRASYVVHGAQTVAGSVLSSGVRGVVHPSYFVDLSQLAARAALQGASTAGHAITLENDPVTVFKGKLGVPKRVAWSYPVSVDETKAIGYALGAKINDVLVSVMAGALRRYMIDVGDDVTDISIRAVVPVDMRPIERALDLGNAFGLVFLAMPVCIADSGARLREVKKRMDALKESNEAVLYYSLLNIFGMTPRQVEESAVHFFAARATTVFSNVAGPRMQLYFAGRAVNECIFWVPQSGRLGMGISIMSYNNQISLGVITDAGLVPDPERITEYFGDEYAKLQRVAQMARAAAQWPASDSASDTPSSSGRAGTAQAKPRCAAINRNGTPCRNAAVDGFSYCARHAAK